MRAAAIGLCLVALACEPVLYSDGADAGVAWKAPENTWPSAEPPEALVGEGMNEGQLVYDIRGMDQHGDEVSIWQFWGHHVLIDISTMWCGPCQELATGTEAVYQEFLDAGVIYYTVLHENEANKAPSREELEAWAQFPSFNEDPDHPYDVITAPIMSDPKGRSGSIEAIRQNTYPVAILVGPDMKILERIEPVTESRIVQVLEEVVGHSE